MLIINCAAFQGFDPRYTERMPFVLLSVVPAIEI